MILSISNRAEKHIIDIEKAQDDLVRAMGRFAEGRREVGLSEENFQAQKVADEWYSKMGEVVSQKLNNAPAENAIK